MKSLCVLSILILMSLAIPALASDEIYIVSGNTLFVNSTDNTTNFTLVFDSHITNDILIDDYSMYVTTDHALYSVNRTTGSINFDDFIIGITELKQTGYYIYATTKDVVYAIQKSDGSVYYTKFGVSLDRLYTLFGVGGGSQGIQGIQGIPGVQGVPGVPGSNGSNLTIVVYENPDFSYFWNFSDGTIFHTAILKGDTGIQGIQGDPGTNGTNSINLTTVPYANITEVPCFNCSVPYGNLTGVPTDFANQTVADNKVAWDAKLSSESDPIYQSNSSTLLHNVSVTNTILDQILMWNGVNWINTNMTIPASAGHGVQLFFNNTYSNGFESLKNYPDSNIETDESTVVNNNISQSFEKYKSDALGGTLINGGEWSFDIYTYVSQNVGTTELIFNVSKRNLTDNATSLLFSVTTDDIDYMVINGMTSINTVQQSFPINSTDVLIVNVSAKTDSFLDTTVHFVHSGTTHYSHIHTPIITLHNDLAGLQGGASGEYYHMTSAEYGRISTWDTITGKTTLAEVNSSAQFGSTSQVTGLVTALSGKEPTITGSTNNVFWNGLKNWIALGIGNITGLQGVLDGLNTTDTNLAGVNTVQNTTATNLQLNDTADRAYVNITFEKQSNKSLANGYAGLDAASKVPTVNLGGAGADNTKYLRGDQTWQVPGGSSDPWTYKVLPANATTTSATAVNANASGVFLNFTPVLNTNYEFEAKLMIATATTTVNPRVGLAWSNGITYGTASIYESQTATTQLMTFGTSPTALLSAVGGLPVNNVPMPVTVFGIIVVGGSPSGVVSIQLASETAGTQVSIVKGSFLKWRSYS